MSRLPFWTTTGLFNMAILSAAILYVPAFESRAQTSDIYICTYDDGRATEYTNKVTAGSKNCKKAVIDPVVVPKLANGSKTPPAASPPNFPKVDGATQKTRDNDKKRILEEELKVQTARLTELKRTYNNGEPERQGDERNFQKYQDRVQKMKEDITRLESDIQSIRSEIDKIQ